MSDDAFHLNRPVHLARRDVFYEKAVELTKKLNEQKTLSGQQETAEAALHFLSEARKHAEAANRSDKTSLENRLFLDVLDTALDNALSITRMLRRQQSSQAEDCTICRFLGSSEVHQKMSMHYRRSAAYILKGLLLLLQNVDSPHERLRKTSLAEMNATDKARYDKARAHLSETLQS